MTAKILSIAAKAIPHASKFSAPGRAPVTRSRHPCYKLDRKLNSGFAGASRRVYARVIGRKSPARWQSCLNDTRKLL